MPWMLLTFIFFAAAFIITTSTRQTQTPIKLDLLTTNCRHSCLHFHDDKCPSSIKVNGQETSPQKDGFNMVVLNTNTGQVINKKHVRWFNFLFNGRKDDFKTFFRSIKSNSIVILAFQNMCKNFDRDWYKYTGLDIGIKHKLYSYEALIVACKGPCPHSPEVNMPYFHYSSSVGFTKTLTLGSDDTTPKKEERPSFKGWVTSDGNLSVNLTIGILVALAVVVALFYSAFRYRRHRQPLVNTTHQANTGDGVVFTQGGNDISATPPPPHEEPIYEEIEPLANGINLYQTIDYIKPVEEEKEKMKNDFDEANSPDGAYESYDNPSELCNNNKTNDRSSSSGSSDKHHYVNQDSVRI